MTSPWFIKQLMVAILSLTIAIHFQFRFNLQKSPHTKTLKVTPDNNLPLVYIWFHAMPINMYLWLRHCHFHFFLMNCKNRILWDWEHYNLEFQCHAYQPYSLVVYLSLGITTNEDMIVLFSWWLIFIYSKCAFGLILKRKPAPLNITAKASKAL